MTRTLLLPLLILGCAHGPLPSVQQASFDHDCPPARVKVLAYGPNYDSAKMDVCGTERLYQQTVPITEGGFHWVEVPRVDPPPPAK